MGEIEAINNASVLKHLADHKVEHPVEKAALRWALDRAAENAALREAVLRWHLGEMGMLTADEAAAATDALAELATRAALSKGEG